MIEPTAQVGYTSESRGQQRKRWSAGAWVDRMVCAVGGTGRVTVATSATQSEVGAEVSMIGGTVRRTIPTLPRSRQHDRRNAECNCANSARRCNRSCIVGQSTRRRERVAGGSQRVLTLRAYTYARRRASRTRSVRSSTGDQYRLVVADRYPVSMLSLPE